MNFRTPIKTEKFKRQINHKTPVIMMGSCFTDNIGSRLRQYLFDVVINPFGVSYNPMSVKKSITQLISREKYKEDDLHFHNELWFSFDHYTKISATDKVEALHNINTEFQRAKEKLKSAGFLIITFGTAFAYRYKETGEIVCNCHKIPATRFERSMLSTKSIIGEYEELIKQLLKLNPELQLVFTVSPVRHLKDGLVENQRSKAALLLAANELVKLFPDSAHYFPSYEIMMDDLRDYRFYDADMVHPNAQAVDYIWERFLETAFSGEAQEIITKIDPLIKAKSHRPLHTDTEAFKKFNAKLRLKEAELKKIYPELQWGNLS